MDSVQKLLARVYAQRESWVDLGGGKRLKFTRPPEVEVPRFIAGVTLEHVVSYARGWEGFTEADLLGASVGSSDALEFHADLWAAYIKDHTEHLKPVCNAMRDAVEAFLVARAETSKNSEPSST